MVGGGVIEVFKINRFQARFKGDSPTLLLFYRDRPGMISEVTAIIAEEAINIASLYCSRKQRGKDAFMQIDVDSPVSDAALAIRPNDGDTLVNRAAAYAALGDYGSAVANLTTALASGVREPHKAYFNRGAAREALGDVRGAYEDYNTALTIQPDWGPAEAELARHADVGQRNTLDPLDPLASERQVAVVGWFGPNVGIIKALCGCVLCLLPALPQYHAAF